MLIDYPNPKYFFQGDPETISLLKIGKSKRKLQDIKIETWKICHETFEYEEDGKIHKCEKSYIGYRLTGAIEDKNVSEGNTDLEAISGLVSGIQYLLKYQEEHFGQKYYTYDCGTDDWEKITLLEIFGYLTQIDD